MIDVIIKKYIGNHEKLETMKDKAGVATICSVIGIILNCLLFVMKFIVGTLSGSISIMADAFNNIADAGSSLATLVGVKIASYGSGEKHPMGHGRFEWIVSVLIAFLVMNIGWRLLCTSIETLNDQKVVAINWIMILFMLLSVGIKGYIYLYNKKYGRLIDSEVMKAVATDSMSDAIATAAVIVSVVISSLFHINVDGYCGILVSIFIIYNGFMSLYDTSGRIMGKTASQEELSEIQAIIMSHPLFTNVYELIIEDYGMGRAKVIAKVGYQMDRTAVAIQEEIEKVRHIILEEKGYDAMIVAEKVVCGAIVKQMEDQILSVVKKIEPCSYIEHFRILDGVTQKNIYLDIAVQMSREKNEEAITDAIGHLLKAYNGEYKVFANYKIFHDIRKKPWASKTRAKKYDHFMKYTMFPKRFGGALERHHSILKEMLKEVQSKVVLDVACGSGDTSNYLDANNSYTGLDISDSFIELAKEKMKAVGFVDYHYVVGNACAMEFENETFDVVTCNLSMQMIFPSIVFIKEVYRVLKVGGIFIGSVPVSDYGKQKFSYNADINTSSKLKAMIEKNGFQVTISTERNGAVCYFKAIKK